MKLWHWQLLGLTAFLMPLAVTGTAAAISHGHAALVVAPAILYIVLVVRLVRRATSAAIDPPRPHGEDARSAGTKAPRLWRHRESRRRRRASPRHRELVEMRIEAGTSE